jgi:20S proteasome alpha/beta subunit
VYSQNFEKQDILNNGQINKPPAMTFILGCRCPDGVLLAADKKVTLIDNGSVEFDYREKLFVLFRHIIVGSSGSTDNFELFRGSVIDYHNRHPDEITFDNVVTTLSPIVYKLNKRYNFQYDFAFDTLVATQPPDRPSSLNFISRNGLPHEVIDYCAVGSGKTYAKVFLEKSWDKDMMMEQVAELAYFIIKYIEDFKLNSGVGVGDHEPQIWFIPNNKRDEEGRKWDGLATKAQLEQFQINANNRLKKHEADLIGLFK